MADKDQPKPEETPETTRTHQEYFFPDPPFSCKAQSLEEATKLYEQHMKGSAHSA